jgi:phosphatidylserine decarboxylase
MNIINALLVYSQYLLPQHLLSALALHVARVRCRPCKNFLIWWFIHHYKVDLSLAAIPHRHSYPHFNAFFTRPLRDGVRPLASDPFSIVSPVDGIISEVGNIEAGRLLQAKNNYYSVGTLLGGSIELSERFRDGKFITLYLAPRDYHRVHMPVSGQLQKMMYVPGRLFSVSTTSVQLVPGIFTRNERVVSLFSGPCGLFALVLVGALLVGSIETVWAGRITPAHTRRSQGWRARPPAGPASRLKRGQEMGRFNMGSTVIVLFPSSVNTWKEGMGAGQRVAMGQEIGRLL